MSRSVLTGATRADGREQEDRSACTSPGPRMSSRGALSHTGGASTPARPGRVKRQPWPIPDAERGVVVADAAGTARKVPIVHRRAWVAAEQRSWCRGWRTPEFDGVWADFVSLEQHEPGVSVTASCTTAPDWSRPKAWLSFGSARASSSVSSSMLRSTGNRGRPRVSRPRPAAGRVPVRSRFVRTRRRLSEIAVRY